MARRTDKPNAAKDLLTLAKPGILAMCVFMTAGGAALAPDSIELWRLLIALVGTGLTVGSANALNQVWERELDGRMTRTKGRPVAAGRMSPALAISIAVAWGVAGCALLAVYVNPVSMWLALLAILSYVFVYTPMKTRSTAALWIGAIPGAIPPLLGWTAATGSIDAPGVALFLVLLFWQIPHFLAISIYRKVDYQRAGIQVVPGVKGEESAKNQALAYSLILVAASLVLVPLGVAGFLYFVVASFLGAWFFVFSIRGLEPQSGNRWARKFFFASLIYLPVLTVGLAVDVAFFS